MEAMKKEIEGELLHSLHEWGVNCPGGKHSAFRRRAIRDCVATLSEREDKEDDYTELKRTRFPKDRSDAYEHVFRHDDVADTLQTFRDKLDLAGSFPPFFRSRDRHTKAVTGYRLKHEYQGFSSQELDPLDRFYFDSTTKEDFFFRCWFVGDDASSLGGLFEAVVACHALENEACYNCHYRKALRWNGGGRAAWQDMVCTNCFATYEIKTKAGAEKVEAAFRFNNIQGGSFSAWCRLVNSKRPGQKRYLVVLPRTSTFNRKRERIYPVTIAEIEKVLPTIYPGSFDPNLRSVRFKSTISVKLNTKAKWFNLPRKGETIEMSQIATRVFKERFSEETFDRLEENCFHSSSDGSDEKTNETQLVGRGAADPVDGIMNGLNEVVIDVPDDWEELASNSD